VVGHGGEGSRAIHVSEGESACDEGRVRCANERASARRK
jgi:hypothetical protein